MKTKNLKILIYSNKLKFNSNWINYNNNNRNRTNKYTDLMKLMTLNNKLNNVYPLKVLSDLILMNSYYL